MAFTKITKQDIIDNGFNIFLSFLYAILLAVIYSTWIYRKTSLIWPIFVLSLVAIVGGAVVSYIWTLGEKKKKDNTSSN